MKKSHITFKAGTRSSKLALIQTKTSLDKIAKIIDGISFELIEVTTTGDDNQQLDLRESPQNFFTEQLDKALKEIQKTNGLLLYMDQEGRGIGLGPKLRAYELQEKGLNSAEANIAVGAKEELNVKRRIEKALNIISREIQRIKLGDEIQSEVHDEITKTQREYYLREQMKAIKKELGEDEGTVELKELEDKIKAAQLSLIHI